MSYRRAVLAAAAGLFTGGAYLAAHPEPWTGFVYDRFSVSTASTITQVAPAVLALFVVAGLFLVPRAQGAGWGRSAVTGAVMVAAVALSLAFVFYYEITGSYSPWLIYGTYYYWMGMLFMLVHVPLAISLAAPLEGRASSWGRGLLILTATALMFAIAFNETSVSPGGEVEFPGVTGPGIPAWWWAGLAAWTVLPALAGAMSRPAGGGS